MAPTRRPLRPRSPLRRSLDARREVLLHHVTDGPAKGWLHTHGLAEHGIPELEIRNVPLFLGPVAAALVNDVCDYLLNDAPLPLEAGQSMSCGTSTLHFVAAQPDPAGGYDAAHYRDVRLLIVDPPDTEGACEECARELAHRPRLSS